jgi:uncharacterized membrane protein (DUF485 family)
MMVQNDPDGNQKQKQKIKTLSSWSRLLGVFFRLVIIIGLLLLILFIVLFLITSLLPVWSLAFPLSVIVFGIVLARVEYSLHKRLTKLSNKGTIKGNVVNNKSSYKS